MRKSRELTKSPSSLKRRKEEKKSDIERKKERNGYHSGRAAKRSWQAPRSWPQESLTERCSLPGTQTQSQFHSSLLFYHQTLFI